MPQAKRKSAGRPKGSGAANANESKDARFLRVATGRLNKALQAIDGLDKAARSKLMEYTPEQAAFIVDKLRGAVDALEGTFTAPPASGKREGVTIPA